MFERQVTDIPHSRRQIMPVAISLYVLLQNLFHVCAEKPLNPLLVGTSDMLREGSFLGGSAGDGTLRGPPEFERLRCGDQQSVFDVDKHGMSRACDCASRIVNNLQRILLIIRTVSVVF